MFVPGITATPAPLPPIQAQVSVRHRRLVVPFMEGLAALSPDTRKFDLNGVDHMAIPHTEEHVRLARNFGIEAPAPVLLYYDWPTDDPAKPPFHAQKQTVAMLTVEKRAYVLNGMGTGKTRTPLWAFDYLRRSGAATRMLVVAPLSTLHLTWAREAFAVVPHLKVVVLYGDRKKRISLLKQDADIYIINHDGVDTIMGELMARHDIDVVTLDELAVYRNGSSRRWKTMSKLLASRPRVWGLTGSPTPNAPTDAWAQCKLVTPWTVPTGFTSFRESVMLKQSMFKWVPKPSANSRVQEVMQPAVRYTLDDVVELPEVVLREVPIPQSQRQTEVYAQLEKHLHAMFDKGELTVMNSGVLMNKLLQVSLGWVYTNDKGVVSLDNTARMDALVDALESTDRKVIVFVSFIHALEGVRDHLLANGIACDVVSGDTSKSERDQIFNRFQNYFAPRVLVAHPQCMSHGLTLTAADTIIWLGPFASLEVFEQANARITRVGQKHRQQVLMFSGTRAEKKLYQRLQQKQGVQNALLDLFRADSA